MRVHERIRQVGVGLFPLPDDPGRVDALGIAGRVAEDHGRVVEERERPIQRVPVQQADVFHEVVIDAELHRVGSGVQRHLILDLVELRIRDRARLTARAGVDGREGKAQREQRHVGVVAHEVLARDLADGIAEARQAVHLGGDLIQPAVAEHPVVLADQAPHRDVGVLRLAVVVRRRERRRALVVLVAGVPHHHRVLVRQLDVHLAGRQQDTRRLRDRRRVVGIDEALRDHAASLAVDEQLFLVEQVGGDGKLRVLANPLDGAEEERAVAEDRAAGRSAELLAAVGGLVPIGFRGEKVLRHHLVAAAERERRAVKRVGPRLGHHRQRRAAGAAVRGVELARGELELLDRLGRVGEQRAAELVVAIVGAIHARDHVRARGPAIGHAADVRLAPVDRLDLHRPGQQRQHPADVARDAAAGSGALSPRCSTRPSTA